MAKGNVDAVYDRDPRKEPNAQKFTELTHHQVLNLGLGVMDATAASLCMDNNITIIVFSMSEDSNIVKAVCGNKIGTVIRG